MRLIPISIIVIVLFVSPLFAQNDAEDLSLARAMEKGLENNFQIRIAKQNLKIARNNNSWGAAGRYPTLDIGINSTNTFYDEPGSVDPSQRDRYSLQVVNPYVSLRWVLFNGFSIKITRDKLAYLNDISEGSAAVVVENTVQGIVLAYYTALLEKEKLGIVEEVRNLSRDRYDYVMSKKDVGAASTYDVLQAKIDWLSDTSTVLLQQMNLKNAMRNLNLILGEPAEKQYRLTGSFSAEKPDYRLEDLLGKLIIDNKTLRNQYINQVILKKEVSLQRSALYPVVSLNTGYDHKGVRIKYEDVSAVSSHSSDYYVNFSVSLNLFNGGNTRRAIANAKIQEKIGQLEVEEIKLTLSNLLRSVFEFYNVRKQLYTVAEERINSARLSMEISTDKFKSGAINSFNYRDVQLLYLNAAFGKLEAIYNIIDTHSELMRLTGGVISEY